MANDLLIHINEDLSAMQRDQLLSTFENVTGVSQGHVASTKSHLIFVHYDQDKLAPHDVVAAANKAGYTAQMVDL